MNPAIDDKFGYWFAGFFDGEGSFIIQQERDAQLALKIQVILRDDDGAVLDWIREQLGYGVVTPQRHKTSRVKANPEMLFRVQKMEDLKKIVDLFEKFPLRTKKRKEFEIWKKVVLSRYSELRGGKRNYSTEYRESFHKAMMAIREIRKYKENE